MKKSALALLAGALLAVGIASAQVTIPLVQSIGSSDVFQDVVGSNPQAGNFYASAALIGNYGATQAGNNSDNTLVGGDATTNLFQRGTTGSSVTTAVTYGGPDRWVYWSGTNTAMTVSRDATAADLPAGYEYAFKMACTSTDTGVVQVCMMQEVIGLNSYQYQGQTAELDFHAVTGANFSGAALQPYIITGTGANEGTVNAAFGLNAGGGGSAAWTGQVNWAASIPTGASVAGRYTIAAPILSTTTEMAVAICYTPTGTAGTNDYVALSGIQLTRNSALTSSVSGNASGTATALALGDTRAKSFARRPASQEASLQYGYYYRFAESATTATLQPQQGGGEYTTTTACSIAFPFPAPMWESPSYTNALSATTFKIVPGATPVVLGGGFSAMVNASATSAILNFTTAAQTQYTPCQLESVAGGGVIAFNAEL